MASYDKSECPVELHDRIWIENAFTWFEQRLGKAFIGNREYFLPANYKFNYLHFNSDAAIRYFIEFICDYIELDPSLIQFKIFMNNEIAFNEGLITKADGDEYIQNYELNEQGKYEIGVYSKGLNDFDATFISLIYKLTYIKFFREKIFNFANAHMINYAMFLFGFGIIQANAFVRMKQWQGISHKGWGIKRLGILNHRMYGYMFAVLSKFRREGDSIFKKYLCADALNFYKQSVKYLDDNNDGKLFINNTSLINDEDVFIRKSFYDNGKIRQITHLKDAKYEGLATFYHQDGKLWSERIYKSGIPYTVLSNYNRFDEEVEKGTLFEGSGTLYIYQPDGNLQKIETYKDGIKVDTTILDN